MTAVPHAQRRSWRAASASSPRAAARSAAIAVRLWCAAPIRNAAPNSASASWIHS
jgi:hypothetical protein